MSTWECPKCGALCINAVECLYCKLQSDRKNQFKLIRGGKMKETMTTAIIGYVVWGMLTALTASAYGESYEEQEYKIQQQSEELQRQEVQIQNQAWDNQMRREEAVFENANAAASAETMRVFQDEDRRLEAK